MRAQLGELCLEAGMARDVDGHDVEWKEISRAIVWSAENWIEKWW